MRRFRHHRRVFRLAALTLALSSLALWGHGPSAPVTARAQEYDQRVLGPGLYALQTRVTGATCNDDHVNGYVSTYIGSINGVPGNREMHLALINNRYWADWTITVRRGGVVRGVSAVPEQRREMRFEVRREQGRFVGTGSRSYLSDIEGERRRCTVHMDVLLRRFDV